MACPNCGAEAALDAVECRACGLILAKWRAARIPRAAAPTGAGYLGIAGDGWRASAGGAGLALVLSFFPMLGFLLHPMLTLVHELGHTLTLWLFGYPALPAFDFSFGGGVTMSEEERQPLIVWSLVAGALALAYLRRESKPWLAGIGLALVAYFLVYGTRTEALLIALMGHGGELVFGALFLYRGLTAWGCKIPAERPLYAFLGLYILFQDLGFAWSLMRDPYARLEYQGGKGGLDNDFVTAASIMSLSLAGLARLFLLFVLAAVPLAMVAAAQRKRLGAVAEEEED